MCVFVICAYGVFKKKNQGKPHFKELFNIAGGKYDRAFGSVFSNSADPKAKVVNGQEAPKEQAKPRKKKVAAPKPKAVEQKSAEPAVYIYIYVYNVFNTVSRQKKKSPTASKPCVFLFSLLSKF